MQELAAADVQVAAWLTDEYKLTPSEVAQVLGAAAKCKVSEVADHSAGIILKSNKERLKPLASARNRFAGNPIQPGLRILCGTVHPGRTPLNSIGKY